MSDESIPSGRLAIGLLLLYAIAIVVIMAIAGDPTDPIWWIILPLFLAWVLSPFVGATLLIRRENSNTIRVFSLILMGVAGCHGLYVYLRDMFGEGARSTSALIFMFLPVYQLIALLFVWVIVSIGKAAAE